MEPPHRERRRRLSLSSIRWQGSLFTQISWPIRNRRVLSGTTRARRRDSPAYRHGPFDRVNLFDAKPQRRTRVKCCSARQSLRTRLFRKCWRRYVSSADIGLESWIVQALFEEGVLQRKGSVKLAKPISAFKVPFTVQAVLAARIGARRG